MPVVKREFILACAAVAVLTAGASAAHRVDPFIGTAANGHCNPGAARPFAFVYPGPDTGNGSWDYCGGYRYGDGTVDGFSQTHASGTGRAEMGDVLLLPFIGEAVCRRLPFSHEGEVAEPGYYAVTLDGGRIRAEMTSTERTAFHRYVYRAAPARLLVDLQHGLTSRREFVATHVLSNVCAFAADNRTILGTSTIRKDWPEHTFSFAIRFDRPYRTRTALPSAPGEKGPRFVLDFDLEPGGTLGVKVALSMTSPERALANMDAEIPDWDFDRVRAGSAAAWEDILSRIEVTASESDRVKFYTAIYHACLQPNDISDVGEPPRYSTMSIWDTFRAAHPLYTILVPERVDGFVETLLAHAETSGFLPQWLMWGKDGHVMIGNHAVPILLDALKKGFKVDVRRAYAAIRNTLLVEQEDNPKDDWAVYDRYGYYPLDVIRGEGVSRTLECAFDDWCAAEFARRLGREEDERRFVRRSESWRNVFDPSIGFVRGRKADGSWRDPFDPLWYEPPAAFGGSWWVKDFTEGNAWQYTFHNLHDVDGLVRAFGGADRLLERIDGLFAGEIVLENPQDRDASGRIGQYAHGNEPCHHVPYLYALLGRPEKTREIVSLICRRLYGTGPDGLCGNDDCGQMSAWLVFSMLGFYPFNPASAEYVLGTMQVEKAVIRAGKDKPCVVLTRSTSAGTVEVNGKPVFGPLLRHADLALDAATPDVESFIRKGWRQTVRTCTVETNRFLKLPHPYTVPCASGSFQEMYYWDTYFTNVGLLLSGETELAENNVRNIAAMIGRFGFMPNGSRTYYLNRSQPPFFTRMVREVYAVTKDKAFLAEMYGAAAKEHAFWTARRKTPSGLFRYAGEFKDETERINFGKSFVWRAKLPETDDPAKLGPYGDKFLSYAESGWDCTSRFPDRPQDGDWLDLNSLVYGMACDLAFFAAELGNGEAAKWTSVADRQREAMNRVLWDEDLGMFCDHDAVRDRRSDLVSAATFYPLFTKVATPEQAARIVRHLPKLECRWGVAASENRNLLNYQWDYPQGWACLQLVVAQGLINYGYTADAKRIARKYVEVADKVFSETGALWEKYDVVKGTVSVTKEYESPKMLGWSAGVYLWCRALH